MEPTLVDLFSTVVGMICIIATFSICKLLLNTKSSARSKFPPGSNGLIPIVGETFQLAASGPEKFIHRRMEKYPGKVFRTSLLGENVAVVCGPEGNKFLLYSPTDCVVPWIPSTISKFMLWSNPEGASAKVILSKGRHFVHETLRKGNTVRDYITVMDSMAREHMIQEWELFDEVKVYTKVNKFALSLACRLLLGIDDPIQVQRFSDAFGYVMSGLYSMPIDLPGTTYNNAVKEIGNLKKQILKIIEDKKQCLKNSSTSSNITTGNNNVDILSWMLMDPNFKSKPESEIAFNLITLLIPSHESTSSAATFALKYVAELPRIHDKVYKEMIAIANSKPSGELLNWEDIQKMRYSWCVISESLRLTPPGLGTFREATKNLDFAGFTIPKGWKVLWSPFTTNKDPKYFPDPDKFDPTRHGGNGPEPGTHMPFSMGPRKCPGQDYAKFVILVYMYNVLSSFKLQILNPDEKIIYRGGPVPENGLPVRLLPLNKLN